MKKLTIFISGILIAFSCSEKKVSENDIKNQVLTTYNDMYNSYGEGTDEFFRFFENDFLRVTPSGNFQRGVEEQKTNWNDYLKVKKLALESFDEPELIISQDQVITIGGYVEYFIDRATNDSSYNRGVYVATWRKQENGDWKICMDTWHSGLEKK
ncbi:hypothetical protein [Fulvivirga sedimenti]|uniref:DUF4440 domain-containing protein n=1 Tax=Fulvivirga sedimenti TaxID=2879465 RepID=A0A9X1HW15_9BACT|nr:hypothetical protein [Fulvivirga sedimenti]MCA6075012.1 hypothetical protein [Fulvivirga sedimenti]MCA6076189.1 hypothetical protein [Fulvivirga sedimenti]MCA6077317.1 hypothetical protein [Fulvivirga sedimenti]